jgi:hypothetical protein
MCAVIVLLVGGSPWMTGIAGAAGGAKARPRRVLIVALPGLMWSQVDRGALPHLEGLLGESAVGDLTNRTGDGNALLGDGYATLGAGARAVTDVDSEGEAFETSELFGSSRAGVEFTRRTGIGVREGIVQLGIARIVASNQEELFDVQVGAFGDALAGAGYRRAVIANADGVLAGAPLGAGYRRDAVLALMGSDGTLPGGAVGSDLLRADQAAPFGLRLDPDRVMAAFDRVWRDRSVVLFEASDLARVDSYAAVTTPAQHTRQLGVALRDTDRLLGRVLARVDWSHDIVVTVSPSRPADSPSLGVLALHTPTIHNGYLRSATTRRDGFAALVDVAPTVLSELGIDAPSRMEGRPMTRVDSDASLTARQQFLTQADADSRFRDSLVAISQNIYIALAVTVAAAVILLHWTSRYRRLVQLGALVLLGFPTASYLSAPFHFVTHGGTAAYWSLVAAATVAFTATCWYGGRRHRLGPLFVALGVVVGVHLLDAFSGLHLEFNTPFGYSATVGIRLAGIANPTFAQLGAAALLLAGLVAARLRHGHALALGLLAVTLVALVPPIFGQSFGATLAATPAFVLFAWLLAGRRVRFRHLVALAVVLIGSGLTVGFLDLLRPADQRSHVGRFFEQVGNEGWDGFLIVIHRKASLNLETFSKTGWLVLIAAALAMVAWSWWAPPRPLRQLPFAPQVQYATAAGLATLIVLGYLFKDSGIAVPAIMLAVTTATVAYLLADHAARPDDRDLNARRATHSRASARHAERAAPVS